MAWQAKVLVVASRTIDSAALQEVLEARARRGSVAFTLLMPTAVSERRTARAHLEAVVERLRSSGLEIEGELGDDSDPAIAVQDAWDPCAYDEVVVSTLPTGVSRWLQIDLPHRVARLTDAPVTHVVTF